MKNSTTKVDLPVEQIFIFFLNYSSIWRLLSAEYVHLNEIAVPLLINSIIYQRQCISDAPIQQKTVFELSGTSSKAARDDYEALFTEALNYLG